MKFKIHITSLVEGLTTHAPLDGATGNRLSLFLRHLEEDISDKFMDMSKSVPTDAPSFQLSITVNVTGERETNELSISTTLPGASSPTSHSVEESSGSQSDPLGTESAKMVERFYRNRASEKQGPPSRTRHTFEGWLNGNCDKCSMPLSAYQHTRIGVENGRLFQTEQDPALD